MAIKKNLKEVKIRELNKEIEINLEYNGNRWRIITLYSRKIEDTIDLLLEYIQEEYLLMGGDFNARTGNKGGPIREEKEEDKSEIRSKDKVINKEGCTLINNIEEREWTILNSFEEEGGWTYIGESGASVIDYVIGNEKAIEEIKIVEEGIRTESDHVLLKVELTGQQGKKRKNRNKVIEIERSDWTEEGVKKYQENCIGWKSMQNEMEGIWKEIKE